MQILREIFMCLLYITGIVSIILVLVAICQTLIENIRPKKIDNKTRKYLAELEKEVDEVVEKLFNDKEE